MATTYSTTSPYYGTRTWGKFLDVWPGKTLSADTTDALYQIDNIYNLRPDLLAYDLYQDSSLWWVFAIRNPDVLADPLFGFVTGKIIYIPTKATIQAQLNV
jgi:hypothetical protein